MARLFLEPLNQVKKGGQPVQIFDLDEFLQQLATVSAGIQGRKVNGTLAVKPVKPAAHQFNQAGIMVGRKPVAHQKIGRDLDIEIASINIKQHLETVFYFADFQWLVNAQQGGWINRLKTDVDIGIVRHFIEFFKQRRSGIKQGIHTPE